MSEEDIKLQLDESTNDVEDAETEDANKTEKEEEEKPENKNEMEDDEVNEDKDVKEKEEEEEEKKEEKTDDKTDDKTEVATPVKKRSKTEEATPEKPGVPLYDQPLEQSGKRDRRKVERFVQEVKKEEPEPTGRGTSFGDIPFIEAQIVKTQAEELKILHRVCFGRAGTPAEIKKNLRKFNGFPFTKDDKKYVSKVANIEKIVLPELKKMLKVLGLERSGNKGEICDRFINFMMEPNDTGKKPPKIKNKNKSGRGRGRPKKGSEKKPSASSSGESSEVSSSEDDEDEEETPKKPVKKTPAKASKTSSKTLAKKAPKKTPAKRTKAQIDSSSDTESDDEPLAKKVSKPPSDAEIKSLVKKILEGANLEEVTMKTVCKQVYENYPDFDLSHKKAFIKETVKAIIS